MDMDYVWAELAERTNERQDLVGIIENPPMRKPWAPLTIVSPTECQDLNLIDSINYLVRK